MVERTPILNFFTHLILLLGFIVAVGPLAIVTIAASHNITDVNKVPMSLIPGSDFWVNMKTAWTTANLGPKLLNSLIFATGVAVGKVLVSAITAFSLVYFRYPGRHLIFWLIFITLMLPLEVRIVPTYAVAANVLSPFQGILDITGITAHRKAYRHRSLAEPRATQLLNRPYPAADRDSDWDLSLSPVLPDDTGRVG